MRGGRPHRTVCREAAAKVNSTVQTEPRQGDEPACRAGIVAVRQDNGAAP